MTGEVEGKEVVQEESAKVGSTSSDPGLAVNDQGCTAFFFVDFVELSRYNFLKLQKIFVLRLRTRLSILPVQELVMVQE